jgi:hypothetical protein
VVSRPKKPKVANNSEPKRTQMKEKKAQEREKSSILPALGCDTAGCIMKYDPGAAWAYPPPIACNRGEWRTHESMEE